MENAKVLDGRELRRVAKNEFFATLYADARDIMPFVMPGPYPYASKWATNNNERTLFGFSEDVANSTESRYFLINTAAEVCP